MFQVKIDEFTVPVVALLFIEYHSILVWIFVKSVFFGNLICRAERFGVEYFSNILVKKIAHFQCGRIVNHSMAKAVRIDWYRRFYVNQIKFSNNNASDDFWVSVENVRVQLKCNLSAIYGKRELFDCDEHFIWNAFRSESNGALKLYWIKQKIECPFHTKRILLTYMSIFQSKNEIIQHKKCLWSFI